MKIIENELPKIDLKLALNSSLVVVGYFDGLHLYHQKILAKAQKIAQENHLKFILVTFTQKIRDFLNQENHDLLSEQVKLDYLQKNYQLDYLVKLVVNKNLINLSPSKFMNFLETKIGTKMVVEGQNFCFGAQCTGKIKDLIKHFGEKNVVVMKRAKKVSSSKIRSWLAQKGNVKKINFYLRRNLELELETGRVDDSEPTVKIVYPKTKVKPGFYEIGNQKQVSLVVEIQANQTVKLVKSPDHFQWQPGVSLWNFKKFLGQEK